MNPLLDLQKQRDKLALAMRVRLGKDGFQLIARRLPGNLQFAGGDIGRGAARDDAGKLCFRRCQAERFGEDRRGRPWLGPKALTSEEHTLLPQASVLVDGPDSQNDRQFVLLRPTAL